MPNTLSGMLGAMPAGIQGYELARQSNQAQGMNELAQASGAMGLLAKIREEQQAQELKGVLAQTGGDPQKAVEALLKSGSPKAIELATHLKALMPKPAEPFTLGKDQVRYDAQGKPIAFGVPGADEQKPTGLARLIAERDALPPNDPRRTIYDNAIRKESETAKQISPTVVMPQPVQPIYEWGPDGKLIAKDARTGNVLSTNAVTPGMAQLDPNLKSNAAYAGTSGKESAEADAKQYESATAAAENIAKINALQKHLKSSTAVTGLGAEVFKNIERAKVLVANSKAAGIKVSDTELLDAMLGSEVFPMIGSLGIGARGLDTPAEREFLRSVMTGTITLNKDTLIKLTQMRKDIAQRALDRWNTRVDKGELDRYFQHTGREKSRISVPGEEAKPQGNVLAPGTVENGYRFKGGNPAMPESWEKVP